VERSPRWSRFAGRTCDPMRCPCWSSPLRAAPCGKDPCRSCLWEGPHTGAGAECEEEGAAEMRGDELTTAPSPCPLAPLSRRRERKSGLKRAQEEGRGFKI